MEYSAFTEMGGRLVPGVMDMRPADKPDERTSFRYEELAFDVDLDTLLLLAPHPAARAVAADARTALAAHRLAQHRPEPPPDGADRPRSRGGFLRGGLHDRLVAGASRPSWSRTPPPLVSGQIEIHHAEYRPDRSLFDTLGGRDGVDVEAMLEVIDADEAVTASAPRVYAGGLVSSGEATSAGMFMGVDPEREVALTRFLDELVAGRLPEPGRYELLIGDEMARQLAVGVGRRAGAGGVGRRRLDGQRPLHRGRGLPDRARRVRTPAPPCWRSTIFRR